MDCIIQIEMESENLRSGQEETKDDTQTLSEHEELFNVRIENIISMMKKATDEKIKNREIKKEWAREREEMKNRHKELEDEKRVIVKDMNQMEEDYIKEIRRMAEEKEREELENIKLRQEIRFYEENEKARLSEIEELRQKMKEKQQEWETERKTLAKCQKDLKKMQLNVERILLIDQEIKRMQDERKISAKVKRMVARVFVRKDGKPEGSEKRTLRRWWKSLKNNVLFRSQESSVQQNQEKSSANTTEISSCPGEEKETRKKSIWRKWFKR
ncbi:uncharacterized protein LOC143513932 [Brachyhypopomus gauderio]|uniref:uncharacterized protein LOC143513932 n=1 Tax=Brachyhypopomus gauderio TaxID=698409 RepID=UPI004042C105